MSTPTAARRLDSGAEDVRATAASERLLEDSWEARSRSVSRRELVAEGAAGLLFLACAVPLAVTAVGGHSADPWLAGLLVALYALVSRIEFPIGAGYVVPSYLVLVPMLVLLPPGLGARCSPRRASCSARSGSGWPDTESRSGCSSRSPTPGTPWARRSC